METVHISLFAVLLLLAANAFFVAAEFALVKVRGYQLDQAVAGGSRAALLSSRMHKNLDAYLAACQLGITMASLGLGWVGEPAVAALLEPLLGKVGVTGQALHTISFVVGFLIFSSLHIVIGEQVPKTYAIRKPQPVTLALAYPLHWFYRLVFPLNWLLDRANSGVLRLLGVRGKSHHEVITEDEIGSIVDDSEKHGEIEQQTADIIRKAFLFDDRIVREIMVPWANVDVLRLAAPNDENEKILHETLHSRFPVIDDAGDVVGILATKDLTNRWLQGNANVLDSLKETLRTPLIVPSSLLISSLLERMRSTRKHMALVINEFGGYIGLVTLEDLLEEIVGEIEDEWDNDAVDEPIEAVDNGWRASGQVALALLEARLDYEFSDKETMLTLGGLIMSRLGRLPEEGDGFVEGPFQISVMRMDGRRVGAAMIRPQKES